MKRGFAAIAGVIVVAIIGIFIAIMLPAYFHVFGIQEGVIVDKRFKPAHSYMTMTYMNNISIPQTHYVSDAWVVEIKKGGKTNTFHVSQNVYAQLDIGDYWQKGP